MSDEATDLRAALEKIKRATTSTPYIMRLVEDALAAHYAPAAAADPSPDDPAFKWLTIRGARYQVHNDVAAEVEWLRDEYGKVVIANAEVASINGEQFETIQRLTRDLETGFMQGAYARLKSLQEAAIEVERLRVALEVQRKQNDVLMRMAQEKDVERSVDETISAPSEKP